MFSHLHTHSHYSFLDGLASPLELAQAAAHFSMPALALTDHKSLTGAIAFYNACQSSGVKPILGLEVDLRLPYRLAALPVPGTTSASETGTLVLLAEDTQGWHNLCRLSSHILSLPENTSDSFSLEVLAEHAAGLICLTGGCRGVVQRMLETADPDRAGYEARQVLGPLKEIFPGRLYVELNDQCPQENRLNDTVCQAAQLMGLPFAAAHNTYYLHPNQAALQRTLTSIRIIKPISDLVEGETAPPNAYFLSPAEAEARFGDRPAALAAAAEIVERCNLTFTQGAAHYPQVPLPDGLTAIEALRQKAEAGARRLYGTGSTELNSRLNLELDVIASRGYEPIFLIAEEMLDFARRQGIPSASRGSASASLVAHCVGITTPDPLSLDLLFERFLNPARATPPDIDTDFCSRRRDEVIQHLFSVYGEEKVAMVGTVNTFRPRSALSETAKAHGLKPPEIRALTAGLFHRYWAPREDENKPDRGPYAALIAQSGDNPRYRKIFTEAEALLGLPHHLSVHPGGVVIAPGPMVDFVPVARSGGKGVIITQFDLDDVEAVGLVKLDLLGIRGLTVLGDVAAGIHSWRRKEFSGPLNVLDTVPPDDPETAALVAQGRTIGCFQIESPGMRATLKETQAHSIPEIMAALALYRPGPLKGGLRDAFVRRHKHLESVTHIHPALTGLLSETYGVILYQEQVLRIAHNLAGLSLAEADLLRRAMSHFDPGKQMQVLKAAFIEGAGKRSAVAPDIAAQIWEMMAAFAGYGFPKAHAASYAQVAWRSAWCKAHYPAEFIAAVLANWGGYYPQTVYLNEARRMGLPVKPPHVNQSRGQFSVSYPNGDPVLYMGLDQVRGLTHRTQARIQRLRPFHTLNEFILKVDPRHQEVEDLIKVGGFDGLGPIPDLLAELTSGKQRPGQLSLFAFDQPLNPDWNETEKAAAQERLLGVSLEIHPLDLAAAQIRAAGAVSTIEAAAKIGETVRVGGIRQTHHRSLTAQGESMGFLTLEDFEGMLDVVLFPQLYRQVRRLVSGSPVPLIIEGTVDRDLGTGEAVLQAQRVWRVD